MSLTADDLLAWETALAELDPPPRDVFAEIGYTPTAKQRVFHDATEHDVLFGGSLGGGKSRALMAEAIRACVLSPGIRVGAFRRTYGELRESLVPELAAMGFGQTVGGRWNGTEYELRFANGSLLMLRYAESLVDATRRQGGQYQLLMFDERTLVNPDVCGFLESRIRSGRTDIPVLGVRSTANPGGPGHGAVRQRYIDATDYGAKVVVDEHTGQTVRFIPSSMRDNPHLDAAYERRLAGLPDAMRRAMRDGDWGVFSGQVFTEFSRDRHIVPRFQLPASWKRACGIDYGWTAPWVVLWAAQDEDGRAWFYREITARQVIERDQARRIRAAEADDERVRHRAADPAMWARTGEAQSVADQYRAEGVTLSKADNSRLIGKQRMHSFLADGPACAHHRAQGWDECPRLHVLDGTCPELVRTLPMLPYDPRHPEDVDTAAEDHHYDACLVAGTAVLTDRGDVPIERVCAGDRVMTRKGWRRVRDARRTGVDRPVLTVTTSDGRTLTGTAEHPVFVAGQGFTPLGALRYCDTLSVWQEAGNQAAQGESNQSSTTGSPSVATQTHPVEATPSITRPVRPTAAAALAGSTRRSGRPGTAPSLMATTCTTATTIPTTMMSATSSASPTTCIEPTTPASPSPMLSATPVASTSWPRPSGMPVRKAGPGTSSTVSGPGMAASTELWPASTAASRSKAGTPKGTFGSAPTSAVHTRGRPAASTTKTGSALDAAALSGSTATPKPATAPVVVLGLSDAGTADVFNLSVEGEEEYFANGVLVHNCRYLLMTLDRGVPRVRFLG